MIAQVLVDARLGGFTAEKVLTQKLLLNVVRRTVPLATTMSGDIAHLRTWAKDRTRAASGVSALAAGNNNGRWVTE